MHKDPHIANIFSAEEEDCLNLEQMAAYQQGKLAGQEKHQVERHLLNCELCAMTYESLTENAPEVLAAGAAEVADRAWDRVQAREQRKRRGAIFWIASAASIVLLVTVGYLTMRGPTDAEIARTVAEAIDNTPSRPVPGLEDAAPLASAESLEESQVANEEASSGTITTLQSADLQDKATRSENFASSKNPESFVKEGKPMPVSSGKDAIKGGAYDSPKSVVGVTGKPNSGALSASPDGIVTEKKAAPAIALAQPLNNNGPRKALDAESGKKEDRSVYKDSPLDEVTFDGEYESDMAGADDGLTSVPGLANSEVAEELQITTYGSTQQKMVVEKPSKMTKQRSASMEDVTAKEKAAGSPAPAPALSRAPVVVTADRSYDQGLISYKEGNYRDAAKDLRKATERTPNNLEAHIYAADAFLRISQPQAALFHIERILAVPGNSHIEDAEWYKALAFLQLKEVSKAKHQLEAVIARGGKYKAQAETALKNLK